MDISPIVYYGSIFVLAIFIGYYVVWSVTPALHTPVLSVPMATIAPTIITAEIAFVTDINGVCRAGVTDQTT
jgi:NAD(P) transhydrogenase subunit alpha